MTTSLYRRAPLPRAFTAALKHAFKQPVNLWAILAALLGTIILAPQSAFAQSYSGPNMNYSYSGPRVSEADILANPNDMMLNLNYARQQSANGELLSAASTLERLLLLEPNWHSARLFYAAVLYRLDDRQAANRELNVLDGRTLNESQTQTYNDYKQAFQNAPPVTAQTSVDGQRVSDIIAEQAGKGAAKTPSSASMALISAQQGHSVDGRIAVGLRYDDNAGNAIGDVAFGQNNQGDSSAFAQGALRGSFKVAEGNRVRAHGSLNGQLRRHDDFSQSDFDTLSARAGLTVYSSDLRTSFTAQYAIDDVDLDGESYLTQDGPIISVRRKVTKSVTLGLSGAFLDQDYDSLSNAPFESNRTGDKTVILGTLSQANPKSRVSLSAGVENKDARDDALAYDGFRVTGSYTRNLTDIVDLKTTAHLRYADFGDASLSGFSETRFNARIALAAALSDIVPAISHPGLSLEGGINYNRRNTDQGVEDFENIGAEVRLTWDF